MSDGNETIEISDEIKLPDKPLVSIYMLAYRHEEFIAEAINGVLGQRRDFPIELVIGEDKSPDRTGEIVLNFQRRYPWLIRVLTSAKNVGGLANVRRCVLATRGEYVAICEGDDYWQNPDKLKLQLEAFRAAPRAQLCHTDYDRRIGRWLLRAAHARRRPSHLAQGSNAYPLLLRGMTVKTASAMYRRDFLLRFLESPFNRSDWPFGDYPKALLAATEGPVLYLPVSTATYRFRPGSAMYSGYRARFRMGQALADCREQFMRAFPVDDATALAARRVGHTRQMRDGFWIGDEEQYLLGYAWLREHGPKPNPLAHALRMTAMRAPALLRLMRGARSAAYRLVAILTH
jgi:glycosyltransferase involved in cell wall biosynthesis